MRSILIIFLKAIAVTVVVSLGFALSSWFNIMALTGLFQLPTLFLIGRLESIRFLWLRTSVFVTLVGVLAWFSVFMLPQTIHPFIRMIIPAVIVILFSRLFGKEFFVKSQADIVPEESDNELQ